jgi:hypothetical protein
MLASVDFTKEALTIRKRYTLILLRTCCRQRATPGRAIAGYGLSAGHYQRPTRHKTPEPEMRPLLVDIVAEGAAVA